MNKFMKYNLNNKVLTLRKEHDGFYILNTKLDIYILNNLEAFVLIKILEYNGQLSKVIDEYFYEDKKIKHIYKLANYFKNIGLIDNLKKE